MCSRAMLIALISVAELAISARVYGGADPDPSFAKHTFAFPSGDNFEPGVGFLRPHRQFDLLSASNDGKGNLTPESASARGITFIPDPLNRYAASGPNARVADFNGDGWPDVVILPYFATSTDPSSIVPAQLYLSDATTGQLSRSPTFNGAAYQGRGETIVVADFNNDGALDIFFPMYTYLDCKFELGNDSQTNPPVNYCTSSPTPPNVLNALQSFLLLNDPNNKGNFTEAAVTAGISMHSTLSNIQPPSIDPNGMQPEGAQAADFNMDGLIDLYVGGHLFINQGVDANNVPHFKDMGQAWNLSWDRLFQLVPDEGAKFLDWNNDGNLDLVIQRWWLGPAYGPTILEFNGTTFLPPRGVNDLNTGAESTSITSPTPSCPIPPPVGNFFSSPKRFEGSSGTSYGINVYDLNNDGLEDIVTSGDGTVSSVVYKNTGCGFVDATQSQLEEPTADGIVFGDFNHDGLVDGFAGSVSSTQSAYFTNTTPARPNTSFTIEVLGSNGEVNQQGRVVQIFPPSTQQIYTRVVDGGSGYHAMNQYPLLVGTPFSGAHTVRVYYAPLQKCVYQGPRCAASVVSFSINPGQYVKVYAPSTTYPQGRTLFVRDSAELVPIIRRAVSH